jgi:hypothetical protein
VISRSSDLPPKEDRIFVPRAAFFERHQEALAKHQDLYRRMLD